MLELALLVLVVGIAAAVVVSIVAAGVMQGRRTRRLARRAYALNLRFSDVDIFDVPSRYGQFALVSHGHSQRAHNVCYGQQGRWHVQAFDFRYELGHGPRRLSRRYSVLTVRLERPLPWVTMWRAQDDPLAPLAAKDARFKAGNWLCRGHRGLAQALARCEQSWSQPPCAQVIDDVLMFLAPAQNRRDDYLPMLERLDEVMLCLEPHLPDSPGDDVANDSAK